MILSAVSGVKPSFWLLVSAAGAFVLLNATAYILVQEPKRWSTARNRSFRSDHCAMMMMPAAIPVLGGEPHQVVKPSAVEQLDQSATKTTRDRSRRAFLMFASSATLAQTSWAECSCAADAVVKDLMAIQKSELIEEIKKDSKDDSKAAKDTNKLISTLEPASSKESQTKAAAPATVTPSTSSASTVSTQKNDLAKAMQLIDGETRDLIDQLEQEEEQIAEDTVKLMRKVETLEAASERLNRPLLDEPDAKSVDEAVAKSQAETYAFLDKLKKRSAEKEDFIKMLKLESTAFGSGGKIDLKLPEFVAQLRKTSEADKEFDEALNSFRERLQKGLTGK